MWVVFIIEENSRLVWNQNLELVDLTTRWLLNILKICWKNSYLLLFCCCWDLLQMKTFRIRWWNIVQKEMNISKRCMRMLHWGGVLMTIIRKAIISSNKQIFNIIWCTLIIVKVICTTLRVERYFKFGFDEVVKEQ